MVLYKKQKASLSDPLVLPSEFNSNTKVFLIKETGEWFARYEDYIKRLWFYMQKNFTCEITSHSNLTFFQAMASEEREFNNLESKFPLKLRDPVAKYLHFNPTSRFDYLLEETYSRFKKDYFVDETIFLKNMNKVTLDGVLINDINDNVFVTNFLKEHNMQFDRESATSYQEANGIAGDVNEIGVDLSFPWIVKEILMFENQRPKTYLIYQPSSFLTIEVDEDEIRRDRQAFTRHLLRSFMKLTIVKASRKNGSPWCVKEDYLQHYNLTMDWPPELLKYREDPKPARGSKRQKVVEDFDSEHETVPSKKRGRPKSITETIEDTGPPKKRGRKRKSPSQNLETHILNLNENFSSTVSDTTVIAGLGNDKANTNNNQSPSFAETYNDSTPDLKTSNITPQPHVAPVHHYNPNIAKMKQTITLDVEIPRNLSKLDLLSIEEMNSLRASLIENILKLTHKDSEDQALNDEFSKLYTDIYVYGGEFASIDDANTNSLIFQKNIKQYDESFNTKLFDRSKTGFNFTQIFKLYKFLVDFNKLLVLEPINFNEFLLLLNNENRNKSDEECETFTCQFSNTLNPEVFIEDERLSIINELKQSAFINHDINIQLVAVSDDQNQKKELSSNSWSEEKYIDLSITKNPNKFLLEFICSLLRLFINNRGDWRVTVPELWIDEDNKEVDKEAALAKHLPSDQIKFVENCINYKDVSFSERLIKRQFNNGFWCFILLGIFEDSFHLFPYQGKMKNIIEKLYVEDSSQDSTNLNKLLWENFNYILTLNDKLDIIEILVDLLLNFGIDIKQDLEIQMDVVNSCKSERFKINKAIKMLTKEKTNIDNRIETLQKKEQLSEEDERTLSAESAKLKDVGDKIALNEFQKKFWDDKINVETSIRLKPLGQDRYGHRYWYLESTGNFDINNPNENCIPSCGKVFIQGPFKEEIPFFYDGMNHEEYSQKIQDFKFLPDGTVLNTEGVPILLQKNIWNNDFDNTSLSNLEWKMIDWRKNYLLDNDDWCFIDDDASVKSLLSWLHKTGAKERSLKANLSTIVERFESNVGNQQLMYNSLLKNETYSQLFEKIKTSFTSLDAEDLTLLENISQNASDFENFNSLFESRNSPSQSADSEDGSSELFSNDKTLIDLNRKLVKIENQLEPILSKCMDLEDIDSKNPTQTEELLNLNTKKDSLTSDKMVLLTEIEEREKELTSLAGQKKVKDSSAAANEIHTLSNDAELVEIFKTSTTLVKLNDLISLTNQFLKNLTKKDEQKLLSDYKNSLAIQNFGRNMFTGGFEKLETSKNKKTQTNSTPGTLTLKQRTVKLSKELSGLLDQKQKELN